MLRHITRQSS